MYTDLEATLHDAFWQGFDEELPLLETFLARHPGTALELGCGSGRLLLDLLGKGYLMEGLDNSPEMLAICQESAEKSDLSPVLHQADMADFQTGATYSAIVIPAFTLQLLDYQKVSTLLETTQRHLHPGGGLYLTTFIPWAEITGELEEGEEFLDHETYLPDGSSAKCHTTFQIDRLSQRLTREHRYEMLDTDGNPTDSSTSTHHLTWFWPRELTNLLTAAGYQIDQTIQDFNPAEHNENGQIITIFASLPVEEEVAI
ncbi:MAG: class I SAM-dependent methyltransferase [Akkermansiaceae bacterium]